MKIIKIQNLEIELEKKKIKNMYLRILPPDGRIHISAPYRMSDEKIYAFVTDKLDWIYRNQKRIQSRNISLNNQGIQYIDGDSIHFNGCVYNLSLTESKSTGITVSGSGLIMHVRKNSTAEQRKKILQAWYKEFLDESIKSLIFKWEAVIGVKSCGFTIRNMKTRWGSCNTKSRRLSFSLQLAQKSTRCIEYVVVHELVHLLEGSHNHVFKAYMDKFLPDWRRIKKELNGI